MTVDSPTIIYYLVMLMALFELAGAVLPNRKIYHLFASCRTLVCLSGVIYIFCHVGRPPLFGTFEALIYIIFIMGVLSWVYGRNGGGNDLFSRFNSLAVLIILLAQVGKPMALNEDYFMYGNIWVNLFFNFRLLAAAFLVHGASQYLSFVRSKKDTDCLWQAGRNTLLAGGCLYLISEWSGSLWCLNWFGDSWQWSRGFFKASLLFLLVMVVCHQPSFITRNKIIRGIAGALPGIFILWMIFYH